MTKKLPQNQLKIIFSLLLCSVIGAPQMMAQKRVLFICNSAFNSAPSVATSSAPEADPFIKLLKADTAHFTVTTITTTDGTTSVQKNGLPNTTALEISSGVAANSSPSNIATFYANYDLVVTQESFGSANAIWKPTGLLGIKNITIPVIYTKGYSLRSTSASVNLALTDWSATAPVATSNISATAVQGSKLKITIPVASQSNPLFTGIDFTAGDEIAIFKKLASDKGLADDATSVKAVDQVYNANITNSASGDLASQQITLLASIDPSAVPAGGAVPAVVNPNSLMCVNDIPGGTYFGTSGTDMLPSTSRMIFFAYNYGAVALGYSDGVTSNITDNGLKIFKNAALILTNQSLGVNDNTLETTNITVSPNPTSGLVVINGVSNVKNITVFDVTGKSILSTVNTSINLSNQPKGIYLIKITTENDTITKKVVLN